MVANAKGAMAHETPLNTLLVEAKTISVSRQPVYPIGNFIAFCVSTKFRRIDQVGEVFGCAIKDQF
jgi:hypothetical protein